MFGSWSTGSALEPRVGDMTTPAGWYQDPAGDPALLRYWDGSQWTEHSQPAEPAAAPPPPMPPQAEATPPPPPPQAEVAPPPPAPAPPTPTPPTPTPTPPTPTPTPEAQAPAPPTPAAPIGTSGMGGMGGIRTDLLEDEYAEVASGQRVVLQNSKMLKVSLGEDVLARQGSMVAFQGNLDFDHEGSGGVGKFLKKMATGEGMSLMRCSGQGELFLANNADEIHILHLDGAALSVNGKNILAFEPSLDWTITKVEGAGMLSGGLFNTRLEGHGWVAITTKGKPVVLRTDQPTFADTDAVVAWSASLTTSLNKTVKMGRALTGRGSGEVAQLAFSGEGLVIVQPAEGEYVPSHSHS